MARGSTGGATKRWIWAGALGLGGLAGAVGGLAWWVSANGSQPMSKFMEGPVPSEVRYMAQSQALNRYERYETPEAIDRSFLASAICGGVDVAHRLLEAKGQGIDDLGSETLDLLADEDVTKAMKCAAEAYAKVDERAALMLEFEDEDDDEHEVAVFAAHFDRLPMAEHTFRGLAGYCEEGEQSGECDEDGTALVRHERLWAAGEFPAVKALAREWTTDRQTETTDVRIARRLTSALGSAHDMRLWVKPDELMLSSACFQVATPSKELQFLAECWPDDVSGTVDAIAAEARGHAIEQDFPTRGGTFRTVHTLLARDERGAEDIERDLRDLRRDWKARLENQKTDLIEMTRELEDDDAAEAYEAILHTFLRAASEMEVERDGRVVRLRMEQQLGEGERATVSAGLGPAPEDLKVAARVVETLESGKQPTKKDLAHFVGVEAAEWMLLPRASEAQCQAFREHYGELVERGVPTGQFGAKFRLKQWFESDECIGHPLPGERERCLLEAEDVAGMDACPSPPSPREAMARDILRGQWRISKVTTADNDQDLIELYQGSRLQFSDQEVVWEGSDEKMSTQHDARAANEGSIVFRWPVAEDPPLIQVEVPERDEIRIAPEDGSFTMVLDRAEFERSLFAEKEAP